MDQGPRYAIFFVPPAQSALYGYGSAVLGYDCYAGRPIDYPEPEGAAINWHELSQEPRRYGFHATLKAPFHLAAAHSEDKLVKALHNFARLGHAIYTFTPALHMHSGFFAIVPRQHEPALDVLAASCTTIFDAYRAPMSPQERARRVALKLNDEQIRNLDRWGYPYVMSEFRFHMTLTGLVPVSRRKAVLAALQKTYRRAAVEPSIAVDRLVLVKQESAAASFHVISEAALGVHS